MSQPTHTVISGDTFAMDLPTGHMLRIDYVDANGDTQTATVTAADDMAMWAPPAVGRYYLATREDATNPWERAGLLISEALIDEEEERLRSELDALNAQVKDLNELIQYQVSDPSGTAVTRMKLSEVRMARAKAERRLADYRRRRANGLPVRLN